MSVNLSLFAGAGWQFFDNNGVPLAGGLLYTYAAGTTTPLATYTTSAGNIANTNPIVLDSAGRVPNEIWLTSTLAYKFLLKTSTGTQIASYDNISGGVDSASLAASSGSSLIGFIQSGAGAVAETVQTKLREIISVKDFGAVGNGSADDTAAVQAAFTAANGATYSKTVFFPAGTYLINSTITCNPNTPNGLVPQILGEGADTTTLQAGASLGANAILKHQGGSPSVNSKWTGFRLNGTGYTVGQYGVYHINTCFLNYDGIQFGSLAEGIRFENVGNGFTEQNVLTNCWATSCLNFLGFARQLGSTENSFRGTGFASECHMDLTTIANARLVRIYNLNSLSPNCYNMPIHATVWCDANSAVIQNDGIVPFRVLLDFRYESSASGWVMSTGNGATLNFFTGTMVGLAYNPTFNNSYFTGFINDKIYISRNAGSSGSFTPAIVPGAGSPTVTYAANGQQGYYQVIGNIVQLSMFINVASIGVGGSGDIQIYGLPVASATTPGLVQLDYLNVQANGLTFTGIPAAKVIPTGNNYAVLVQTISGTGVTNFAWSALATGGCALFISGQYFLYIP
jgi:hypothetical protein